MTYHEMDAPKDETAIVLPLARIRISGDFNARMHMDERELQALGESILALGLLEPVVVWFDAETGGYWLIAGFRRYFACQSVGLETIRASLSDAVDLRGAMLANLAENVGRQDLTAPELAARLVTMRKSYGMTAKELSAKVGLSVQHCDTLCRIRAKVIEWIVDRWERFPDVITTRAMTSYAALPMDEQWPAYVRDYGAGDEPKVKERAKVKAKAPKAKSDESDESDEDERPTQDPNAIEFVPMSERVIHIERRDEDEKTGRVTVLLQVPRTYRGDTPQFLELAAGEAHELAAMLIETADGRRAGASLDVLTPPPGHPARSAPKVTRRAKKGRAT